MNDVVIVGGGISGMASALLFRRKGFRVTLIEGSRSLAPVLRGFTRGNHYFDTGFHYGGSMEVGEITRNLFEYLGISEGIETTPYDPDCFDLLIGPDGRESFAFPYGWERMLARFSKRFPSEQAGLETYFQRAKAIYDRLAHDSLQPPTKVFATAPFPTVHTTLKDYLDALFQDPFLKSILASHCVLYGMAPAETPIDYHLRVMSTFYQSVSQVHGGGLSVVSALTQELLEAKVNLLTGTELCLLQLSEDGRICSGSLTTGETLSPDLWIFSGNPQQLNTLLSSDFQPRLMRKRLNSYEETPSAMVLYGFLKASCPLDSPANRLFSTATWMDAASEPCNSTLFFAPGEPTQEHTRPFTFIAPMSWDGFAAWSESTHGKRPTSYRHHKRDLVKQTIQLLESMLPEIVGHWELLEAATPLSMKHYSRNPHGGLYGLKRRINDFILTPQTRIENLFLTGQSVLAPGLTGAMMSALGTAAAVFQSDEYFQAIAP